MSINIETTTTQQTNSDELDQLAKHLCGVKLTLSDSGVPTILADSISINGITASTTNTYSDTVAALALKGVTISYTNLNLRILDSNVKLILFANNIGDGTYITPTLAATASVSTIFKNNTNIVAFDEFKYFTAANATTTSFEGCTSLQRIDISNCSNFGSKMFYNCSNLEYFNGQNSIQGLLIIPNGVTAIGALAFSGISKLTAATIPTSVLSIGNQAFYNSSSLLISNLNLPNLISFGSEAFSNTKVVLVSDLGYITALPPSCFYNCKDLTHIILPQTCTSLENSSLRGCTSLTEVDTSNVTTLNVYAFLGDSSLLTVDIRNVTSIGGRGFLYCTVLKNFGGSSSTAGELYLPNLTSLTGPWTFEKCNGITNVTSLGSITSIPEGTFAECSNLTSVSIPSTVTSIGNRAFYGSGLTSITIPNTVTSIGQVAFLSTNITSFTIGSGVTSISHNAFSGCKELTGDLIIPSNVTTFGTNSSSSDSYMFLYSGTATGNPGFNVTIQEGLTYLCRKCFNACRIASYIILPSTIQTLHQQSLDIYTISGTSVTLKFKGSTPPTCTSTNIGLNKFSKIYIPLGSLSAYLTAFANQTGYSNFVFEEYTT